jgi:transcriptional regulator with GAF, ATPase, and Fis domain
MLMNVARLELETEGEDVRDLKSCVNDLISVLALPAIWIGAEPTQIIQALLECLLGLLRVDFVYAEWNDLLDGKPLKLIRHASASQPAVAMSEVNRALQSWLKTRARGALLLRRPAGGITMAPRRLGFQNEIGWVVAGTSRRNFPSTTEGLLLSVATNQAAIGLQEARLLAKQKLIAAELDRKVEERTRELQALKDQLERENVVLREQVDEVSMFEEIVGTAPALRAVLARVARVASTDSTVLITGETGTGKELIARAIHKRSKRSARAFVKVNCAAIPPSLIASELFGHEKGAFTGALQRRLGRFELAQGGTLFLDEVGELPAETQVTLLRVLQEREFERVGGTQPITADVRLIAATNRNLHRLEESAGFRRDLFYRLNVFPIEMPSLRERIEDIPLLTEYFIQRYADKMGKRIFSISKKTIALFRSYNWPGNVRELQNVIERSLILCDGHAFSVDRNWLNQEPRYAEPTSEAQPLAQRLAIHEKSLIEAALVATQGRISGTSGAAARLGLPASTLESKIRALKINKHAFKTE